MSNRDQTFCRIVRTEVRTEHGYSYWILTHSCGKIEERVRSEPRSRYTRKAPTKVICRKGNLVC